MILSFAAVGAIALSTTAVAAPDPVAKCQAAKIKAYGARENCRAKEQAKEALGNTPDLAKCKEKLVLSLMKADEQAATDGVTCRFVDHGIFVLDLTTGLTWEKKSSVDGVAVYVNPNDGDNGYNWYNAIGDFISRMNGVSQSRQGPTIDGAGLYQPFAGFKDWRLPTIEELATVFTDCFGFPSEPCFPPELGPLPAGRYPFYWTGTSNSFLGDTDYFSLYNNLSLDDNDRREAYFARAVRDTFGASGVESATCDVPSGACFEPAPCDGASCSGCGSTCGGVGVCAVATGGFCGHLNEPSNVCINIASCTATLCSSDDDCPGGVCVGNPGTATCCSRCL